MSAPDLPLAAIIPAAPNSPWLAECLDSLEAEGLQACYVVSEASSPRGRSVEVPAEAGFAERANAGLRAAADDGFEVALLVNDDTRMLPGAARALWEAVARDGVAVAGAVLLDWNSSTIQQAGIAVGESSARVRVQRGEPDGGLCPVEAVGGAAMALDLPVWDALGGFDERFTFYFEDIDLCRRARSAGHEVVVVREARVEHRGGGTRSHHAPEAAWHLGRSHVLFARGLGGGTLRTAGRLVWVGALGCGWTVRSVGPTAVPRFARGWWAGLSA